MKEMQRNDRDCLPCCLATLFNIPYEDVPKFYELYEETRIGLKADEAYNAWLRERGYFRLEAETQYVPDQGIHIAGISLDEYRVLGILKKPDRPYSHVVILRIRPGRITIEHDPKPNTDYDLEDITHIEYIFPIGEFL